LSRSRKQRQRVRRLRRNWCSRVMGAVRQVNYEGTMQDILAHLERLRDVAECERILVKKCELFDRLAAHLTQLACEVERAILERGKKVGE
jgi:hypothetical protein